MTTAILLALCFLAAVIQTSSEQANYGTPLFLTPYINSSQIEEAQDAARVVGLSDAVDSYSGYITVNQEYNSNIFFWFFPAANNPETAPLLVWMNGGPGSTSFFGLFTENGPFVVDKYLNLGLRTVSWTTPFSVIYIEQPVGTGFSFTDDVRGHAVNEEDVADDLYEFLLQWFTLFPQYQTNDFYITGESYGGKYVPAISYKIFQENPNAELKFNFKGFAIGNGWTDPINMINYGDYYFNIGIIGANQNAVYQAQQNATIAFIQEGDYARAHELWNGLIMYTTQTTRAVGNYFFQFTGLLQAYNFLEVVTPADQSYFYNYLELPSVRRAIHAGNLTRDTGHVAEYLYDDFMKSVAPWVVEMLNSGTLKIMFYNGQLDLSCPPSATANMISNFNWYGAEDFANATRIVWRNNGEVSGYSTTSDGLTFTIIRNAGHMVPYDQPVWALDALNRFINDIPYDQRL